MHTESKLFPYLSEFQTFEVPFFQQAHVGKKDKREDLFDDLIRVDQRHFFGKIYGSAHAKLAVACSITHATVLWESFEEQEKRIKDKAA